jgi:hypothetical protein
MGGNAPHGGTTKSSTAVFHGFCGHWNTAFNFDLHFGGAAAKTSSQLIHDVGSLSNEKTIPLCARAFSLFDGGLGESHAMAV